MAQAVALFHTKQMDSDTELKSEWVNEIRRWEVERNRAKCEQTKPRWVKPKFQPWRANSKAKGH
jgi:hypothetical protein